MPIDELSAALEEVRAYLETNQAAYLQTLDELQARLREFARRSDVRHRVYRVYSRADKQLDGSPLKAPKKIARALLKLRTRAASEGLKRPGVRDVTDIIGTTVVVYFESDVGNIADLIRDKSTLPNFRVLPSSGKGERNQRGYFAHHLIARRKLPKTELPCEIQVKTLLHDGWGTKTHDLTYKPTVRSVRPQIVRQMELMGEVVQGLEKQSEVLKDLILEEWAVEKKRLEYAQSERLARILEDSQTHPSIRGLMRTLESLRPTLIRHPTCADELTKFLRKCEQFASKQSDLVPELCRVVAYLASLREWGDLDAYAMEFFDRNWLSNLTDPRERVRPLMARALVNYTFGATDEALEDIDRAIATARDLKECPDRTWVSLLQNRAYFLAEKYFAGGEEEPSPLAEAQDLIRRAKEMADQNDQDLRAMLMDTEGAVLIACGTTEEDIRRGLDLCRSSSQMQNAATEAIRTAYFRLHEHRAWKRILQLHGREAATSRQV